MAAPLMRLNGLSVPLVSFLIGVGIVGGTTIYPGRDDDFAFRYMLVGVLLFICGLFGAFCWVLGFVDCDALYREMTVQAEDVRCQACGAPVLREHE